MLPWNSLQISDLFSHLFNCFHLRFFRNDSEKARNKSNSASIVYSGLTMDRHGRMDWRGFVASKHREWTQGYYRNGVCPAQMHTKLKTFLHIVLPDTSSQPEIPTGSTCHFLFWSFLFACAQMMTMIMMILNGSCTQLCMDFMFTSYRSNPQSSFSLETQVVFNMPRFIHLNQELRSPSVTHTGVAFVALSSSGVTSVSLYVKVGALVSFLVAS